MKLNAVKFGLAGGILSGLFILLLTFFSLVGSGYASTWTGMIVEIYGFLGYSISWFGVVLGAIYGFIDGFIFCGVFALIYNKLL